MVLPLGAVRLWILILINMQTETEPQSSKQNGQVTLAFLAFLLIGINSGAFGVLLPDLISFYQLDKSIAGLLFLAGSTGYLLAAFGSGFLVERLGIRRFLILGCLILITGCLVIGFKLAFILILSARLLLGLGAALIETGANFVVASLPRSTVWLNYLHALFGMGALIGPLIATWFLTNNLGWNSLFFLEMILCLPLLIGVTLFFPSLPSKTVPKDGEVKQGNLMATTLRLKVVWVAAIFLLVYVGVEMCLGGWGYSYLIEIKNFSTTTAGWIISGYWLSLTLGRLIPAKLAEIFGFNNYALISFSLGGTALGIVLILLVPNEIVTALGLWVIGFSLGPVYPTTLAIMAELLPKSLLPTVIGFVASLSILGFAIFPWLAGSIADIWTLSTLIPFNLGLTALMIGVWFVFLKEKEPQNYNPNNG
jgi:fucose permease